MDQRSMAVLNQLMNQDAYISVQELATLLNVSRRTIYNDLEKVNHWLKEQQLAEVKQVRAQGLYLDSKTKTEICKKLSFSGMTYYEFSPIERRAWIYLHLVGTDHACFLEDIRSLFQVSRNTALEDVKNLREDLKTYELDIYSDRKNGYSVTGNESDIRRMLIYYLSIVIPKEDWYGLSSKIMRYSEYSKNQALQPYFIFDIDLLTMLHQLLQAYEQQYRIEFTDDVLNNLVVWFHFFIKRIKMNNYVAVDPIEQKVIMATDEYTGAKTLCDGVAETLAISMPSGEIVYFAKYLLSSKVNYSFRPQIESEEMQALLKVVEQMVTDFQIYAAIEFQEPEQMIQNLLLHLKPAYYRIRYQIEVENALRDSVIQNYPEVFHLTKKVVHHFEDLLEQTINENEIAFIAMHFGGWLRKEGVHLERTRKKMLIVCTNGLGTSRLLESQLEGLFSDVQTIGVTSLREYEKMNLDVDFIVSTIPLPDRGVPVLVVNPVLNNADKEQLLKKVNSMFGLSTKQQLYSVNTVMDIIQRYARIEDANGLSMELKQYFHTPVQVDHHGIKPSLIELLPAKRIVFRKTIDTWEDAINVAAKPLLNDHVIKDNYIEKMIDNIANFGPYVVISEFFALPHANPEDGVIKTGMSMLHLENPVNLMGKSVQIVVVLASRDNEQHLRALSQLTKLFSNQAYKDKVMHAMDKQQIVQLIKMFSTS